MEEFATQWNRAMALKRKGEPLPTNSRIRFIEGKVLYSPNSRRDVRPPLPRDPARNPFLPELSRSPTGDYYYNFSEIGFVHCSEPFWWTHQWGWAAFIPRHLDYSLSIFEPIWDMPSIEEVAPKDLEDNPSQTCPTKYSVNQSSIDTWADLEASFFRAAHDLALLSNSNVVKPALPWVFGYKKRFSSRSRAVVAIRDSRQWFGVWMGLLSYLVARAEKMFQDLRSYPCRAIPQWCDHLCSLNYPPAWVHAFATACTAHLGDSQVGAFVDMSGGVFGSPLISWLERYRVPVWYFLDLSHVRHPELSRIGPSHIAYPLDDDIMPRPSPSSNHFDPRPENDTGPNEVISTSKSRHNPLSSSSHFDPPPGNATGPTKNQHNPTSWQEFFTWRDERNKKIMQKESPEQQKSRQDREKNPPMTSAKVYTWVPDDSGMLVREMVCRRERADTLAMYADDEIKYDSFLNEYDCCEDFGSGQGLSKLELVESWEDDDDLIGTVAASDLSRYPDGLLLHSKQPTLTLDVSVEPADEWLPTHVTTKSAGSSAQAEQEILNILKLHFGYTCPLPALPPPSSLIKEAEQKCFLRVIGIAYKSVPSEVFKSPNIVSAVGFIRRLCQQSSIPDAEWDLNRNHPQSLAFNRRVKDIKVLPGPTSSPKIFMFDFGSHQTVAWKLAVTSASDAMMICHLDPDWDEVLLSLFLVQNGVLFHTLCPVSVFPQARPCTLQFPSRPPQYLFDAVDYGVYLEDAKHLLKGPRGRVALMMGGYIWRLAVALVSFDTVFEGPSGLSSAILKIETEKGEKYFDDQMTEDEADILCGLHHCQTGQGDQIAKKSWYPLQHTYQGSGHDYRRWTSNSEAIFNIFNTRNLAAIHDSNKLTLQQQPLPANKWRDASRGSGDTRRSRQCLENASLTLISAVND